MVAVMTNYAIIENDKVINVIVADTAEIAIELTGKKVIEATDGLSVGWTCIDGTWLPSIQEETEVIEEPEASEEQESATIL
jgi:hypothetical protein